MAERTPPDAAAEASLVERAKGRSPGAWAEIYDAHYACIFRYCYARTSERAVAEDLAAKVFLDALEGIDRYQYRGRPLLAWLYRIAHNVVVDQLRSNGRERKAIERAGAALDGYAPGPHAQVGDQHDLRAAIDRLSPDQRQVLTLRYLADFDTREIAAAMDRSEQAVYSLEVRALAALQRLLEPERYPAIEPKAA